MHSITLGSDAETFASWRKSRNLRTIWRRREAGLEEEAGDASSRRADGARPVKMALIYSVNEDADGDEEDLCVNRSSIAWRIASSDLDMIISKILCCIPDAPGECVYALLSSTT
jgi:hypothetical protein